MNRLMAAVALSRALTDWMAHAGQNRDFVRKNNGMKRDIGLDRATVDSMRHDLSFGR